MIEPIELTYALVLLPAGRLAFRRWRWELWHGPQLLAAGWRLSVLHAQRALRLQALRYAHRIHGLHLLRPEAGLAPEAETAWCGRAVAVDAGALRVMLRPRSGFDPPRQAAGAWSR